MARERARLNLVPGRDDRAVAAAMFDLEDLLNDVKSMSAIVTDLFADLLEHDDSAVTGSRDPVHSDGGRRESHLWAIYHLDKLICELDDAWQEAAKAKSATANRIGAEEGGAS